MIDKFFIQCYTQYHCRYASLLNIDLLHKHLSKKVKCFLKCSSARQHWVISLYSEVRLISPANSILSMRQYCRCSTIVLQVSGEFQRSLGGLIDYAVTITKTAKFKAVSRNAAIIRNHFQILLLILSKFKRIY